MQLSLKRRLLRLAVVIHKNATTRDSISPVRLPTELWSHCQRLARLANLARERGLTAAEKMIRAQLVSPLNSFVRQVDSERALIEATEAVGHFATALDIYHDLEALHDEFPFVSWNTRKRAISVTTEPITLEGVELGSFEIRLHWDSLDRSHAYETIAIDANAAGSDKSITHPHVQDGTLCEGEGRLAIGQALASGRLLDFFIIVRSLLTTYNSSGAYVHLDRWSGIHCSDCGDLVTAEAVVTCHCGRHAACESCSSMCTNCNDIVCSRCSEVCSTCGDLNCAECIAYCESCGVTICSTCNNSGRCDSCEESDVPTESQTL